MAGRNSRSRRSRSYEDGGDGWRKAVALVAIVAMVGGVGAWFTVSAKGDYLLQRDPQTLCLDHAPAPLAVLTMLDETDPLAMDSGGQFTRLIYRIRDDLPRNGRLQIVRFDGDLGKPLDQVFDICSPGRGSEATEMSEGAVKLQRQYDAKFKAPLDEAAAGLRIPHESDYSPIVEQIERAVADPTIRWQGERRVLNILTDGLQHTPTSKIYTGGAMHLPPPPPDLLRGVTVNYYELASAKYNGLQTPAVREAWRLWFEAAGATVNMYAPGYRSPDW